MRNRIARVVKSLRKRLTCTPTGPTVHHLGPLPPALRGGGRVPPWLAADHEPMWCRLEEARRRALYLRETGAWT
ncbi:hypothetical protein [Streptomyces tailanensis]|uniref:hypothetical protein n=1 Tax=Streptomyces tailanensis TaxID=2569858 RepID=UPI00122E6A32|nr:hypothetical protein [Streptomyces tailanensis]